MARFVVDIDTQEFDELADKTATLVDALENAGYKIVTVYGILDDNRCQFDDPGHNVERMINSFRIVHDCVLAPPESATVPKGFRKKTEKELKEATEATMVVEKPKVAPKAKKKRGRPAKAKQKAEAIDAEIAEEPAGV